MCKIHLNELQTTRSRAVLVGGICLTGAIVFLIHWQLFHALSPRFRRVNNGRAPGNPPITTRRGFTGMKYRPTMPYWASSSIDIVPYRYSPSPTALKSPTLTPVTVTQSPVREIASPQPSLSPATLSPTTTTWRPTIDRPHSEFLVVARNSYMHFLRDFIGLIHYKDPNRPIFVIIPDDLFTIYVNELTNMESLVIISPFPHVKMFGDHVPRHQIDIPEMLSAQTVASRAFPGTCFVVIDLSCMTLWNQDSIVAYERGKWPESFPVPEPVSCDLPKIINECKAGHPPMILMPAKVYWSGTHDQTQQWLQSQRMQVCADARIARIETIAENAANHNPTAEGAAVAASIQATCDDGINQFLNAHFESQSPSLMLASPVAFANGRHPKCNTRHVLRSQEIHPFPTNSKLNICFCIPTRGASSGDWSSHPLIIATLSTMRLTLNKTSSRFNRRLYVGWEDSDTVLNAYHGTKSLLREIRAALQGIEMEIILVELPPVDQNIVYIWNILFAKGFDDGCDYEMHITDDVDFVNSPGVGEGWEDAFVDALMAYQNIGLVSGPKVLNTQPFVHRSHIEMFGSFYPEGLHNIWCDTVIWALYNSLGMLRGPTAMEHWINLSDDDDSGNTKSKGKRRYTECGLRPEWQLLTSLEKWSPNIGIFNKHTVYEYLAWKGYALPPTVTL